jgi:Putative DNA-binding domain
MRFEAMVSAFEAGLATPGATPAFTRGPTGVPDARRFQVYRNNVASSLIISLENRFPVVRQLVGGEFFRGLAGAFVARHKPASAVLIRYGADFPDFIAAFEPARDLPYLPDVARLENAWVEAYHAAEATPVAIADLATFAPERFADLVFAFHPSARLLRFSHPAASIWASHQGPGEPRPPERWEPEQALIVRPDADVAVRALPPLAFDFALALASGRPLGEAAVAIAEAGEDVGAHLAGLMGVGAISGISLSLA